MIFTQLDLLFLLNPNFESASDQCKMLNAGKRCDNNYLFMIKININYFTYQKGGHTI